MSILYGTDLALVRFVVVVAVAPPDASLPRRFLCRCLVFPNCAHSTARQLFALSRLIGWTTLPLTQVTTCFSLKPVARASSRLSPLFGRAPVAFASYADWRGGGVGGGEWPGEGGSRCVGGGWLWWWRRGRVAELGGVDFLSEDSLQALQC